MAGSRRSPTSKVRPSNGGPADVNVTSVTDNDDGTYSVVFDTQIDVFTDAAGFFLSADGGATFQAIIGSEQLDPFTIVIEDVFDRTTCTQWRVTTLPLITFIGGGTVPASTGSIS